MAQVLEIVQFVVNNGPMFLAALVGVFIAAVALLHSLVAIFMLVPGAEPEATLQSIVDKLQKFVDFVQKFSKK